jgi:hypothetical protein
VRSSFEEFIETKLTVQSEFNLVFWFMSYNSFLIVEQVGQAFHATSLLPAQTRWLSGHRMCSTLSLLSRAVSRVMGPSAYTACPL